MKLCAVVLLSIFSVAGRANDSDFLIEILSPEEISTSEIVDLKHHAIEPMAAVPLEEIDTAVSVQTDEPAVVQSEPQQPEESALVQAAPQKVMMPAEAECCVICPENYRPFIEAKFGYFFFADSLMREVYDKGGVDLQLSGRYPIYKWLEVYGSFEYAQRSGHSLGAHEYTSIWLIPLSLGLQGVAAITSWAEYYVTLGPRYVFLHQHNDSAFVDTVMNKNGIGGFVNTGFLFFPLENFVIDFFGEYSYVKMHFHPDHTNVFGRSIQVGGFAFGAGLGYAF